jgi:hypothetical protein
MNMLTLDTLAQAKRLPAEFLRSLGVDNLPDGSGVAAGNPVVGPTRDVR